MNSNIVSSKQVEVSVLDATLAQLRSIIQPLTTRESRCLRRLNELKAKTAALPRSVLATIFEFACEDGDPFAITLGSVCSHWRDIVWSAPRLWNVLSIALEVTHDQSEVSHCSYELLRLYFTNAKDLPLTLAMRNPHLDQCNKRPFRKPGVPYKQLFELIFRENPQKLGIFSYTVFTTEWWQTFSKIAQPSLMINLKDLEIGWHYNFRKLAQNYHITAPSTSPLTNIPLIGPLGRFALTPFPYTQITVLYLCSARVDDCLDLLLNTCLNLRQFRCVGPLPSFVPLHPTRYSRLTIDSLEILDWQFESSDWTKFLLTSVNFPSLHTLYCRDSILRRNSTMWKLIDHFIQKQQQLTILEAHGIPLLPRQESNSFLAASIFPGISLQEDETTYYLRGFFDLPDLEELNLTGLDARELEFVFDKLRMRRKTPLEDQILPRLQVLRIDNGEGLKGALFKPEVFSSFVRMLRSRRDSAVNGQEEYTLLRRVRLKHLHSLEEEGSSGAEIDQWLGVLGRLMEEGLEVELAL